MVRPSFSKPFAMIRPFSRARKGEKQDRKESIDQTVLSGDDSRLLASQELSPSFDVDAAAVEVLPPNFEDAPANNDAPASGMRSSKSQPSFFTHDPIAAADGDCPCHDCELINFARQNLSSSLHSYPRRYRYVPKTSSHNPQQPGAATSSPKNAGDDPALQARIEAIRIQQQLLGENHPDVIFALSSLSKVHKRRGNHAEAATFLNESQMRSKLAKSTPSLLSAKSRPSVPNEIFFSH